MSIESNVGAGRRITVTAEDGHTFSAYLAMPAGTARGGLIVLQDVFGANRHFRDVADRYAADGYVAIVPSLFDRVRRDVELPYTDEGRETGRAIVVGVTWEMAVRDVVAARTALPDVANVGIVGFCWGGNVAWRTVCQRPGFAAASAYYPGRIADVVNETPSCPVQFHYAERDHGTGPADIEQLRAAQGDRVEIFVYPAEHGFNCDIRSVYDAASSALAGERTRRLLRENVG
jgi:carboxymethylenebutenolidase